MVRNIHIAFIPKAKQPIMGGVNCLTSDWRTYTKRPLSLYFTGAQDFIHQR